MNRLHALIDDILQRFYICPGKIRPDLADDIFNGAAGTESRHLNKTHLIRLSQKVLQCCQIHENNSIVISAGLFEHPGNFILHVRDGYFFSRFQPLMCGRFGS